MKYCTLAGFVSLALATTVSAQVAVVNSASFRPREPVTAGSLASAFGTFAGVTQTAASAVPLPKSLAGVRVLVDNTECALLYVSDTQINFQVPGSLGPGTHQLRVVTASGEQSGSFVTMSAGPGLFVVFNSGDPPVAAASNQNGTIHAADSTEARGRVITLYATGPGALSQSMADGEVAPITPLITTVSKPTVYIAGVEAPVEYSGLAPTFVGLWQINVRIPDRPFISGRVPVRIFMDGVDSNEVSIFVAQ
jgi:uncharacterized protein (TIGR03437 family)